MPNLASYIAGFDMVNILPHNDQMIGEYRFVHLLFVVDYDKDGPYTPEEEEQRHIAKHKMLGNIKFIGEI